MNIHHRDHRETQRNTEKSEKWGTRERSLRSLDGRGGRPHTVLNLFSKKTNSPQACAYGLSGGLLWIDQEVVTLRGLFGYSGLPARPTRRAEPILNHR